MSISSVSSSNTAASNLAAYQTSAVQPPAAAVLDGNTASQTTVTLSAAAVACAQASTTTDASQDATQTAAPNYSAAVMNSQAILGTGQNNMATALQTFGQDWDAEKQTLAAQRPDLLNQRWDIVTDQGTIQVVSSTLSKQDIAWLSGKLNQDAKLVTDTQTINTIMLSTFSGTTAMAANDPMDITLSTLNQNSIDGTVHFLTLLADADKSSYDMAISLAREGDPNLTVIAPSGSAYNNPYAGNISAISDLPPLTAIEGSKVFPVDTKIEAAKSDAVQHFLYAQGLNDAFATFLEPAFGVSLVTDGTDFSGSTSASSSNPASSDTMITPPVWWAGPGHGAVTTLSAQQLQTMLASASTILGSNARTYGETLAADNTPASAAATAATSSSAPSTGTGATATGVGAIQNIYQESGQALSSVQKAIQPAMKSLGNDWNAVKAVIAAKRPDLLNQNWDFVTDNGTVQAVSSTLTDEQKSWLTGILNQNQNLVGDTQTINQDLVNFYKTTPLGNAPDGKALPSLTMQNIDGIIPFLKLMSGADPATLLRQGLENEM